MRILHGILGTLLVAVIAASWAFAPFADETDATRAVSHSLLGKAIEAMESTGYDTAMPLLEQAVVADPKNARAYTYLGQAYHHQGKDDLASKYYAIALDIDPDQIHALQWSGELALTEDAVDVAEARLSRLSRLCGPECPEYKALQGALSTYTAEDQTGRPERNSN